MQDVKPHKKTPTREAKAIAGAVKAVMARRGLRQKDLRPMLPKWSDSYFDRRMGGAVEMSLKDLMQLGAVLNYEPTAFVSDAIEDLKRAELVAA